MSSSHAGVVRDGRLDPNLNLETVNQTGVPDEFMRGPNLVGYDSEGGLNRFSRYKADFRPLNFDANQEPRTHDDQGQYNQPLSYLREKYSKRQQGETRLPERRNVDGYPENRDLGLTSSWFEARREIQDLSRFLYKE